jgi:hypothetical protein
MTTTRSFERMTFRSTSFRRTARATPVRAAEHAGPVGARRLVGELGLAGLLDDAAELAQHLHGALVADGIAIWMALASVFSACTGWYVSNPVR